MSHKEIGKIDTLLTVLRRSQHFSIGPVCCRTAKGPSTRVYKVVSEDGEEAAKELRTSITASQAGPPARIIFACDDELDLAVLSSTWWPECHAIAAAIRQERATA